jgi:hypothetical protein
LRERGETEREREREREREKKKYCGQTKINKQFIMTYIKMYRENIILIDGLEEREFIEGECWI